MVLSGKPVKIKNYLKGHGIMLVEILKIEKIDTPIVTSVDVAETFEKEHYHVLEDIRRIQSKITATEFSGAFIETSYLAGDHQKRPMYYMNRDGFTLLAMGYTGETAMKFKLAYIKQFNQMEEALKRRVIEREKGIAVRNALTKALQISEEQRMHGHAYSNYTNAIYRVLFGMDAKRLREKMELNETDNIRDHFSTEQIAAVESMERLVSGLVDVGMSYDKIKEFIESFNTKRMLTGE